MSNIKVTWLTGEKKLWPISYRLTETTVKQWWRNKTIYWVESDFGRLGPYDDKSDALQHLRMVERC